MDPGWRRSTVRDDCVLEAGFLLTRKSCGHKKKALLYDPIDLTMSLTVTITQLHCQSHPPTKPSIVIKAVSQTTAASYIAGQVRYSLRYSALSR